MKANASPWLLKSFVLWCIGFCLVTFDLVAVLSVHGFKVKAAYFFFFASFLTAVVPILFTEGSASLKRAFKQLYRAPWNFWILIIVYSFSLAFFSPTKLKSFAYSTWLSFDLICIFGTAQLLRARNAFSWPIFLYVIAGIISFLSVVILLDEVAFYAFGMHNGWIGYNQDTVLRWGVSRPMAFSYEPSYVSIYFSIACIFLFAEACLASTKTRIMRHDIAWISLLLGFAALVVTTSRCGWLATSFGLAVSGLFALAKIKKWYKEVYFFAIISAALIFAFVGLIPKESRDALNANLVHSALTLHDGSGHSRVQSMLTGLKVGRDTHFLGTGLGASFFYVAQQADPKSYINGLPAAEQGAQAVMSTWAEIAAELGLFGLLVYGTYAAFVCLTLKRLLKGSPTIWAAFSTAVVFFVFTAHWLPNISRADVWVWYSIWGILGSKSDYEKNESHS